MPKDYSHYLNEFDYAVDRDTGEVITNNFDKVRKSLDFTHIATDQEILVTQDHNKDDDEESRKHFDWYIRYQDFVLISLTDF